jgi:hypothetical protein
MQKILFITSDDKKYPYWTKCLGHEIHITRIMVLDMLLKNKVNTDDIIVTFDDRKFLYSKIFTNIINYEKFLELDKKNYDVINIIDYSVNLQVENDDLKRINYTIPDKFYNDELKNLCLKIDYVNLDFEFLNNYFLIIHHRYNAKIENLEEIIKIIKKKDIKIIIFNSDISNLKNKIKDKSIFYIDNLQIYASLLNNKNCKLLISEWSGGGQLSAYTSNCKILYYYDAYTWIYNPNIDEKQRELNSLNGKYISKDYDFKSFMNNERLYYKNSEEFIKVLDNII